MCMWSIFVKFYSTPLLHTIGHETVCGCLFWSSPPCPCTTFVFATGMDIIFLYQCFCTPLASFWQRTTCHFFGHQKTCCIFGNILLVCFGPLPPCPCTTFAFATGMDIIFLYQCFCTPLASFWQRTTCHFFGHQKTCCIFGNILLACFGSLPPCPCTSFVFATGMDIIFV